MVLLLEHNSKQFRSSILVLSEISIHKKVAYLHGYIFTFLDNLGGGGKMTINF